LSDDIEEFIPGPQILKVYRGLCHDVTLIEIGKPRRAPYRCCGGTIAQFVTDVRRLPDEEALAAPREAGD